jgi:CHAD domain-containing protein
LKQYAQTQIEALIARFSLRVKRAAENADARSVHDLRVSIRRLSRGLRVFAPFFPGKSRKRVRRELAELMDAAAQVRDRDIAIELLEKAGIAPQARIVTRLESQRRQTAEALQTALRSWQERNAVRQWKGALEL